MGELILRPMTPASFDAYVGQSIEGYAQEKVRAGAWPPEGALERSRQDFAKLLPQGPDTPGQRLFDVVLASSREVVGWLWLEVESARDPGCAFIYDIQLDPAYRGRGLGKETLSLADEVARSHGCREIRLHVFGHNETAIALYRKVGYSVVDLVMKKPL
jgi:ribosomal protein S18 acetylase RimI-like enzyme